MRAVLPSWLEPGWPALWLGLVVGCRDPEPATAQVCAASAAVTADGFASETPCGELLTGATAGPGPVTLPAGAGALWRP